MTLHAIAIGLGLLALSVPSGAVAPPHSVRKVVVEKTVSPDGTTKTVVSGDSKDKAIVAGCGTRHFETSAQVDDGSGGKRLTKIKLCAKPGQDDAAWLQTLKNARHQVDSLTQLPLASRVKLAADFDAEIARVGTSGAGTSASPAPVDPSLMAGPPK